MAMSARAWCVCACARVHRVFVRRVCPPCVPVRRACVRARPPCFCPPCLSTVRARASGVRARESAVRACAVRALCVRVVCARACMAHGASRIAHPASRVPHCTASHRDPLFAFFLNATAACACMAHGASRIAHRAPRIAHRASPHIARRSASRVSCRRSSEPADQASQLIGQKVTRWP